MTSKEYFEQQTTAEIAYHEHNYELTKKACLNILRNIGSIRRDLKKSQLSFRGINKPFVDYAYFVIDKLGVDEEQKEIIDLLIEQKLITKKYLKEMIDLIPFNNSGNAKTFFIYLTNKKFLTESEMAIYLKIVNDNSYT